MDQEIKRKSLPTVLKSASEADGKGIIEAYVSVFGVKDSYGDVMVFGCFASSIANKYPKAVWMHRWDQPIGKTIEIREIPAGDTSLPEELKAYGALYVKGQFSLDVQQAKEAFCLIRDGIVDEFSIGYWELASSEATVDGETQCHVTEVRLAEWSPVLFGANPLTQTISAKGSRLPFAEHSEQTLGCLQEYATRAEDLTRLRSEKGEAPALARIAEFRAVHRKLGDLLTLLDAPSAEEIAQAEADALAATL